MESSHREKIPYWRVIFDQAIVTDDIIKFSYPGEGTTQSPYLITWISNDHRNPLCFPVHMKWIYTVVMGIATLAVSLSSSAYVGGIASMSNEFGVDSEIATLGVSMFVLGFALGPFLWAPMSERWGRQYVFTISFGALTLFTASSLGARNIQTMLALRFFAGAFGSSTFTNAGGMIADLFTTDNRGLAMTLFALGPFLGPLLGPIVGGYLGKEGWKWLMAMLAMFAGALWITGSLLVPETYSPILLRRRAVHLSSLTGNVYKSRLDECTAKTDTTRAALSRPWIMLLKEPIVLILALYVGIVSGTLYMMFTAFPIVYQEKRGWGPGTSGLAFLGIVVGLLLGFAYTFLDNRRYVNTQNTKHNGHAPPECRLPPCLVAAISLPIGLFWFAWTDAPSFHWMVNIAAGMPFGFGMVILYLSVTTYLVDSYTMYASSALAAVTVLRSIFSAVFPLFTTAMYNHLGLQWGASVPAFLALACIPFPFVLYTHGAVIRGHCEIAAQSAKNMRLMQCRTG